MACECIHLLTNGTIVLLTLIILKTVYMISHFPPDLETLLVFFCACVGAEMRYSLLFFSTAVFSSSNFLLFEHFFVHPPPRFQPLLSNLRKSCFPSPFSGFPSISFRWIEKNLSVDYKQKSSAGDPLVTGIRETLLWSENRCDKDSHF